MALTQQLFIIIQFCLRYLFNAIVLFLLFYCYNEICQVQIAHCYYCVLHLYILLSGWNI